MPDLHLARDLALPAETVTQTLAILGIRGSGKTNTAVVFSEELLKAKHQVVIIDPVDVWWGLKSSKDGARAGYSIPAIGGDHADVPLDAAAGAVLADFVVDTRASVILALRHLSMNEQRRFAADFAKRLYDRKGSAEFRSPLMLVVDEADEFVPQRLPHGHEAMFGAFDRLVRRGRSSGIGVTLISQRAQVLNKDVLSQMETLIGMRVLHKLDRAALQAWIEAHDTEGRQEEFLASLASLERGDAWIWSPAWLGVFKRVHIRARETFDSSATPKAGERLAAPKEIAPVDLEKLRSQMAAQIEKAKADDPAELRKRIAAIEVELRKARAAAPDPDASAIAAAREAGRREADEKLKLILSGYDHWTREVRVLADDLKRRLDDLHRPATFQVDDLRRELASRSLVRSLTPAARTVESGRVPRPRAKSRPEASSGAKLPVGERSVLTACAQYPDGATREQLSILTGYKRSSRDAYVQRLREKRYVEVGDFIVATDSGVAALGSDFEPLPTGMELQRYWLARLPEGERKVLEVLLAQHPDSVDREAIDRQTEYKRSSRDAYIQRLKARQLVEIVGRGEVRASEVLFE